jgi:hypothetical protein
MTTINTEDKAPYDMIIEILHTTNDGNDLSPQHLKLVEIASNNNLSEAGEVALYELYSNVKKGYTKPWFLGIEHMTRDQDGFVYWKDTQVEHYDHDHWCSEGYEAQMFNDAKELSRRCLILESAKLEVNSSNVIWNWDSISKTLGVFKELETTCN